MRSDVAAVPPTVAVVVKGYPRLSETFIAQEILALEGRGLRALIVSLRHPTERRVHAIHDRIAAPVTYLPEYLYREPIRVLRAWLALRRRPGYRRAREVWLGDLKRDRTPNRIRRFGQALVLARELPPEVSRLHFHFLHTPGSVARYTGLLTGLALSGSAHARDIWTLPAWEKREKLAAVDWLVTCTAVGRDHLAELAPEPDKVELAYHGLDFGRFPEPPAHRPPRDGSGEPVILISVGRAVAKKGHEVLLDALTRLPFGLSWRLVHIGGGSLLKKLKRRAARAGLAGRIEWLGARPEATVIERLRSADLFVLASRVAADGDRDGLPNVLLEAQSQGLACVASRLSAIPELIEDGATGVLVPPDDPVALATALERLITRPELRRALGRAGWRRVRERFGFEAGIERLAARFGLPPAAPAEAPVGTARRGAA
ncbi:MAG: glycosyltransferase family 4 protein [Kiloniellales bacterium]